ncbi:MAG TPA: YciI family protein [Candidatus Limnocylindrales bacterium]|nr:YciI family protein [Candidatus Limnocylindrales bacterium]
MAQYLLSVIDDLSNHEDPANVYGHPSAEAAHASWAATGRFNDKLVADGYFVFANGLGVPANATVVDGRAETPIFTDGPYVETKEFTAGFWVIEAPDLDVALKLAAEGSRACGRKVEVRPFLDVPLEM